ncbi:TVP38/TMEM64 family protein [Bacillus sp. T33-2]|uniref:TVP38/TMEM64 family protein n=1 Tax=Bacillus sp. T33-2 TaxID=2054168 RepID=UPI000C777265|nr:VTT domain-containing protein [Bacillus sp. T33-2]PLR98753.1 TVP38/TMEM64 family protein [Bacillus sp. T33-2]
MKKSLILIIYLATLAIGFLNKDAILPWIENSDPAHLPFMFLVSAALATIPIIPFTIFAGIMGAKYGVVLGFVINWFGSVVAAMIYFLLARFFFRKFFRKYLERFKGINHFHGMVEKNSFISILLARLIPIIPTPVINIYSGVMNVSFATFTAATAVGKLPPAFMVAYSGSQLFSSFQNLLTGLVAYALFLVLVLGIYRLWHRKNIALLMRTK